MEDNIVILECLKHHITPSHILQYNLEDQMQLFGCKTILSSISPVGLNFICFLYLKCHTF